MVIWSFVAFSTKQIGSHHSCYKGEVCSRWSSCRLDPLKFQNKDKGTTKFFSSLAFLRLLTPRSGHDNYKIKIMVKLVCGIQGTNLWGSTINGAHIWNPNHSKQLSSLVSTLGQFSLQFEPGLLRLCVKHIKMWHVINLMVRPTQIGGKFVLKLVCSGRTWYFWGFRCQMWPH